jgi:Xaa-Pro aminopeptidase
MPQRELARRRDEVGRLMADRGIDLLLVSSTSHSLGNAYTRYFTDYPPATFPEYLLLSVEGEMKYVAHSEERASEIRSEFNVPEAYAAYAGRDYGKDAEFVARLLKEQKIEKMGVVFDNLPTSFYVKFVELVKVQVVDATDIVDMVRAIKSDEELKLIEMTAQANDRGLDVLRRAVRPGRRECEVMLEVQIAMAEAGCEDQFYLVGSRPMGELTPFSTEQLWSRRLKEGDILNVLIEPQGPGGYYTEIMRSICIGRPPSELVKLNELAGMMQGEIARMLKPGIVLSELYQEYSRMLREMECAAPTYMLGHSQGLDMVEKPELIFDERGKANCNMNISIHPTARRGRFSITIGDGFIVSESGSRRMHKTPQELFVA